MTSLRFGTAISAIALATALGGCASSQSGARGASIFGGKVDQSNIGLATKALMALNAENYPVAIGLAERAVDNSPKDAGFRALLGNAYFGAGRFASAEAAYGDSLTLIAEQPQIILKLALVQIAQGKNAQALQLLAAARGILDAADHGLAVALAGQTQEAVASLELAARQPGADSRLRQNLALAHALNGDWNAARVVAEQDLSPDLVDGRIQHWMQFAKPARPADQVAALIGVVPARSDPGQPVRLALYKPDNRQAQAAAPAPVAAAPVPPPAPVFAEAPAPEPAPAAVAEVLPESAASIPAFAASAEPATVAAADIPALPAPVVKAASDRVAKLVRRSSVRSASLKSGGSAPVVVQLGAYGSADRVGKAWNAAARRYSVLKAYAPMSARFNGPQGPVHRLSVRGFGTVREAVQLCTSLRRAGGSCFVRNTAGDAPVQFASR